MLFDTHVHLDDPVYDSDRAEVLARCKASGVERMISVGCDLESSLRCVALAGAHEEIYASLGIHPHEAKGVSEETYRQIERIARSEPKAVAIGEIGLDYYYDFSEREDQLRVFAAQLELADSLRLPVIIHTREAIKDTLDVLKAHIRELKRGGVIHCFSGSRESAEEYLSLGFYVAFGGAVTFKNAHKEEVVRTVGKERLLLETDCPYQTPVPYRGKRNEPAYVRLVAKKIAEFVEFDVERATAQNAARLFGIGLDERNLQ